MGNVIQTWFIGDLALGHVDVGILVTHSSHVHATGEPSLGPFVFGNRLLNICKALRNLSKLSIDVFVVGFGLVSVLIELTPQVELQIHL